MKQKIISWVTDMVRNSTENYVQASYARHPEDVGMKLYDNPIFAFGDALDPLFEIMRDPMVIGSHFLMPIDWLTDAKSVITIFYPFTQEVKKSNMIHPDITGNGWLYARIEGQNFISKISDYIVEKLKEEGYKAVAPQRDSRYKVYLNFEWEAKDQIQELQYTSNWSERHAAFICGLGTFGLSKNIITEVGCAGRLAGIITNAPMEYTKRKYTEVYEYCTMCGECIKQCPVDAIDVKGKDKDICRKYLDYQKEQYAPRFGCGKCQVQVPCMDKIPVK